MTPCNISKTRANLKNQGHFRNQCSSKPPKTLLLCLPKNMCWPVLAISYTKRYLYIYIYVLLIYIWDFYLSWLSLFEYKISCRNYRVNWCTILCCYFFTKYVIRPRVLFSFCACNYTGMFRNLFLKTLPFSMNQDSLQRHPPRNV